MIDLIKKIKDFYQPPKPTHLPPPKIPLDCDLQTNIEQITRAFHHSSDLVIKYMELNINNASLSAAIVTIDGMIDKKIVSDNITNPLAANLEIPQNTDIFDFIQSTVITSCDQSVVEDINTLCNNIMSGLACILLDGCNRSLAVGVQGYAYRTVDEPDTDVLQRGSREGFVEPIKVNMTLLRRRLQTTDLKFETMTIGSISNTQAAICYHTEIVSEPILKNVKSSLKSASLETLFASGYLVTYLEQSGGLFCSVGITERPDTAAAKICEGKIVILVDGTPSALIVPHIMAENFQTLDDYSNRPYFAAAARWLKYISFVIASVLPGLYVALAAFNPEFFPSQLLTKVASSISKTPFSAFTEVLLFTFIYEIMREAGLRLPKNLGHAVSIIGGLVIGDTAVSSGFIGAPTLMIVALTVICSYVIPDLYAPIAVLRFLFIIFGGFWGLWGIFLLFCIVTVEICSKESFGIPFMAPIAPLNMFALRDVAVRADWHTLSRRNIRVQDLGTVHQ